MYTVIWAINPTKCKPLQQDGDDNMVGIFATLSINLTVCQHQASVSLHISTQASDIMLEK